MMSRMGHMGVSCQDCHSPHSSKLIAPVENNALCMQCHTPPGIRGATPIDPAAHMFHGAGTPGGKCVDCHMPEQVYMVRDWRRDHGFTSPDPRLTIELGIPNACNQCHKTETAEWSEKWVNRWYGEEKMEGRIARQRARVVAAYHEGDDAVVTDLLAMAKSEEIEMWRAALVSMLGRWRMLPEVEIFLREELTNANARVRSSAVQALASSHERDALLGPLREDTHALVRMDATLATIRSSGGSDAYEEVMAYLHNISDQPAGALRNANVAMEEGRTNDVMFWTTRMLAMDASASSYYMAGRVQFAAGMVMPGLSNMLASARMDIDEVEYSYSVSLALAEQGYQDDARGWLEETVRRDPEFGRGWYNLGLAYAGQERLEDAAKALGKAGALMPDSAEPPFALATVWMRMHKIDEARKAATRALAIDPNHFQARMILNSTRVE
jgi:predicted CXXCH cytochrome family protein